jgi:outer membrane protein assembly factor BamD (BamD/ComL family)
VAPLVVLGAAALTVGLTAYASRAARRSSSSTEKRQALIAYLREHLSGSEMAIRVVYLELEAKAVRQWEAIEERRRALVERTFSLTTPSAK